MNEKSVCARWKNCHWDCAISDALIDPEYFNPPVGPTGKVVLKVVAFYQGKSSVFARDSLGSSWVRTE